MAKEEGIKVICKKCGRRAMSNEFALDHVYRMMVCPLCVKERKTSEMVHAEVKKMEEDRKKQKAQEKEKPAGWDAEDDYLERMHKMKMKTSVKVERVDDSRVKYQCPKCKYNFIYDRAARRPQACPYCSSEIGKIIL